MSPFFKELTEQIFKMFVSGKSCGSHPCQHVFHFCHRPQGGPAPALLFSCKTVATSIGMNLSGKFELLNVNCWSSAACTSVCVCMCLAMAIFRRDKGGEKIKTRQFNPLVRSTDQCCCRALQWGSCRQLQTGATVAHSLMDGGEV